MINDLDLSNWKELDILTDDLWLFANRDKSGKHKNVYHGNLSRKFHISLFLALQKQAR